MSIIGCPCCVIASTSRRWPSCNLAAPAALASVAPHECIVKHGQATISMRKRGRQVAVSASSLISDDSVPEGHANLHGALYGEGGAEVHGSQSYEFRPDEDDGSVLISVLTYIADREGEKPLGVYAIYDEERNLQYIGYSRNMVMAVRGHQARVGEERCCFIRAMVFANRAMATRRNMELEVQDWMTQAGTIPPGNGAERGLWEGTGSGKAMSAGELAEYEAKKTNLQKAMGQQVLEAGSRGEGAELSRERLRMAMESDDWSAVIDEQARGTVPPKKKQPLPSAPDTPPVVTPFAKAAVHRSIGNVVSEEVVEMTVDSVDEALNEVRPYLIADGGNVEVADVKEGTVYLRLQGACGSCPSSTATLKMGIERTLRARFQGLLRDVVQVDAAGKEQGVTVSAIDAHLDLLRPAISNYGGIVQVLELQGSVCRVMYTGPAPIGAGIKAAIQDEFPSISEVLFVGQEG